MIMPPLSPDRSMITPGFTEPRKQQMSSTPRLLFVVDEDLYFCKHRMDLARAARQAGYEVLVATLVQQHAKQIEDEGFKLLPIRLRRGVQPPFQELASLIELIRLYRRERPDIVHHVSLKQVLFGSIAARITRVPAMVNAITGLGYLFHSEARRARRLRSVITPVLRWTLAHPRSSVIFENGDDCEDVIRAGLVKRSRSVVIRGAGVNISEFSPSSEPRGDLIVILAARMLWDKGVGEFVDAARLLKARGLRARCVLVGMVDKESPSAIAEEQLRRWEAEGIVEWLGHREDMADVYTSSHIVVLPSYAEGLPMVLLEAAACARPLIATRVRGCREIVRDGENGLLVPVKDAHALAQAIMVLLNEGALRERMGTRSREIAVTEFGSERIAGETIAVYRRL
jgi:glycosyltransferase involved in cell wall biosynthesis